MCEAGRQKKIRDFEAELQYIECVLAGRFQQDNSESMVVEMDHYPAGIGQLEDNAAFNFVNALEDLLWAFALWATASWIFYLANKRNIYCSDVFRVADKDWGADFRKLSAGTAFVGLTLWLDHMQAVFLSFID